MSDSTVSGSVRFSITDLLYYAPRFTELGIALSTAEVAAETRLDTLGEFWGHSSPDRAFAHGYPPSQYAALIIVKQLATELEGIGGGIELMAKNYGIAEDDINRQLGRINQAASDETRLLRGTGGLPGPPDIPPDQPPKSAPRTIPSPQPQPSPTPPGGSAPPTRQSSPVPNPNPGTPPDPDTWRRTSSTSLMGPWPSGDVNKMEEAAEAWRELASALDTAWADTQRYAAYVLSDNEGLAATTFSEYIKGLIDRKNGVMTLALQACEHNRYACINQAQAIRQLKRSYEELAVQLVFAFVIGQVVSFFTAESTQAMSDAIDAGLIARITALLEEFVTAGAELTGAMESTVKTLSSILTKAAVGGPKGVLAAGATAPFTSAIAAAFGDKPTDGATALKQLLWGGGLGALGGLVGGSAAEMSTALENASAEGGPSSTQLRIIAKGLADGSVTVAAANDSLGQLIQNGEVNPANLAAAAIGAKLEGAINAKKGDEGD